MADEVPFDEKAAANAKQAELVVMLWHSLWKRGPLHIHPANMATPDGVERILVKAVDPHRPGGFVITAKEIMEKPKNGEVHTTAADSDTCADAIPAPQSP